MNTIFSFLKTKKLTAQLNALAKMVAGKSHSNDTANGEVNVVVDEGTGVHLRSFSSTYHKGGEDSPVWATVELSAKVYAPCDQFTIDLGKLRKWLGQQKPDQRCDVAYDNGQLWVSGSNGRWVLFSDTEQVEMEAQPISNQAWFSAHPDNLRRWGFVAGCAVPAKDQTRPTLNMVKLVTRTSKKTMGMIDAIATDGFRLAIDETSGAVDLAMEQLINPMTMGFILTMIELGDPILAYAQNDIVTFVSSGITVTQKEYNQNYPDVSVIIPKIKPSARVTLNRQELEAVIKEMSIGDADAMVIHKDDNVIKVSAGRNKGIKVERAIDSMKVNYQADLSAKIEARADFDEWVVLRVSNVEDIAKDKSLGDTVTLNLYNQKLHPVMFSTEFDGHVPAEPIQLRCIVMPLIF